MQYILLFIPTRTHTRTYIYIYVGSVVLLVWLFCVCRHWMRRSIYATSQDGLHLFHYIPINPSLPGLGLWSLVSGPFVRGPWSCSLVLGPLVPGSLTPGPLSLAPDPLVPLFPIPDPWSLLRCSLVLGLWSRDGGRKRDGKDGMRKWD